MHLSSLISLASVIPSLVAATGTLGFALGDVNPDGSCKSTSDYEANFDAIAKSSKARLVRGYDASECDYVQQILPAAKSKGFQVVIGIWPDTQEQFTGGINAIQNYMPGYEKQVYAITVGSETLYRGTFTGPELNSKIQQVKKLFPSFKIGTADSWNLFANGTANAVITGGSADLILANAFAYWQGSPINNATHTYFYDIMQAFQVVQSQNPNIELWTGETGWPSTGGTNYESAVASTANAKHYWDVAVCGILDWSVNVFYFEAFDEPQKPDSVGTNGQAESESHWGAFTAEMQPKFPLTC